MGLYDDLPVARGDQAAEASAAAAAPSVPTALAPAVRRMASASAVKHHQRPATATATTTTNVPAPPVPQQQREKSDTSSSHKKTYYAASFGPFDDDFEEYDPRFPNDFSALAAAREAAAEAERQRAEAATGAAAVAAAAADRERRIAAAAAEAAAAREREGLRERKGEREEKEEEEEDEEQMPRAGLGSAVRPSDLPAPVFSVPDSERGMPLAAKMMAKMGWEQGKGLGKQLQGAPLPLVAKKTSARAAVVVSAKEEEKKKPATGAAPAAVPSSFSWPEEGQDTSRVVLLTNVAPPGLSEEALGKTEDEIGMAAAASGGLRSVSVFEVDSSSFSSSSSSSSFPREALVRVFVEFGDAASAARFARGVQGQPFFSGDGARGGGAAARPFSLGRLRGGRLAPEPGDVP